jgi:isopentenyl-diphosphate delta-isomerase
MSALPRPEPVDPRAGLAKASALGARVVLVDQSDRELGTATKERAHAEGLLHRAVSVVITDEAGNVLLQRRAEEKYHSAGLWTNACCTHPTPRESPRRAAIRRLREEMGIRCRIRPAGIYRYRAQLTNGLIEHELDHVFVGRWRGTPQPDASEVAEWRWMSVADLLRDLATRPWRYTAWLNGVMARARAHPLLRFAPYAVR